MKQPLTPEAIAGAIAASPKYRCIAPQAIDRIVREEYRKQPSDCEKRARNRLHLIADAFASPQMQKNMEKAAAAGNWDAVLAEHASTRERLAILPEFTAMLAEFLPAGARIVDCACGLLPILTGKLGYRVTGLDIQMTCVDMINRCAVATGAKIAASGCDLIDADTLPEGDITFLLKLLPVLDAQKSGAGMALLTKTRSPLVLVSYPTRTLGGRSVGMEQNYSLRFEEALPDAFTIRMRRALSGELFYLLERKG